MKLSNDFKPSQIEQLLIGYLRLSKASKGISAIVFILLKTDDLKLAMCDFLSKNEEATEQEILDQARRLADTL